MSTQRIRVSGLKDCIEWPPEAYTTPEEPLLGQSNEQLRLCDPLWMNLLVAKGIPSLKNLEIQPYVKLADEWAEDLKRIIPTKDAMFLKTPQDWKNDIRFFRLGLVCWYVDAKLGIRYRDDQRDLKRVLYTDANDLFLNGIMDNRQGTCGNMPALHVVIGWRLGWPVSLACAGPHYFCRYDDGKVTHNIEATQTGKGAFFSSPDEHYLKVYNLSPKAVQCGSDLRAVTPRELLGLFIGLRARHYENIGQMAAAERDYLTARALFPQNRHLHNGQMQTSVQMASRIFGPEEKGHPNELVSWLWEVVSSLRQKEQSRVFQISTFVNVGGHPK